MEKINLNEIPNKPGIYIFKDDYDEPIYVGKAKNLRKRVPSYLIKILHGKQKDLHLKLNQLHSLFQKMKPMLY